MKPLVLGVLSGLACSCSVLASMDDFTFDQDSSTDAPATSDQDSNTDASSASDQDSGTDAPTNSSIDTSTGTHDVTDTQSSTDAPTDSSSHSDTSSDTHEAPCPAATHACVEPPVVGWSGPSVLYRGEPQATPPACGGDYPSAELDEQTEFLVAASTCSCSCGEASGVSCAGSGRLEYHGSAPQCDTMSPSFWNLSANCSIVGGEIFGNRYWQFDSSGLIVAGGSCQVFSVEEIPAPTPQTRIITCGGAMESGDCAGSALCLPKPEAPFESQLCIWRSGDVLCPTGSAYSQRALHYTGYTETRECAECSCSSPAGHCALSYATLVNRPDCGTGSLNLADLPGGEECVLSSTAANTVAVVLNKIAVATCAASTATLQGQVEENKPYTLCCLAP